MSRNTRKRSTTGAATMVTSKKKPRNSTQDTLLENIFASSWKNSDIILVCGDTEFHVHRTILTMHSPVFEAMFGGNFKEANEKRIELPGKNPDEMLQFLKLLYPDSMIQTPIVNFKHGEKMVLAILRIADEYQTEELMKKCLEKIPIVSSNVFEILPYASKYSLKVRGKCVNHVVKNVKVEDLEKGQKKDTKLEAPLMQELLFAKCRHLQACLEKHEKKGTCRVIQCSGPAGPFDSSDFSSSSSSSSEDEPIRVV